MVVGVGGDRTPGTTYVDALQAFVADPETEGPHPTQLMRADDRYNIDWGSWWANGIRGPRLHHQKQSPSKEVSAQLNRSKLTADPSYHTSPAYVNKPTGQWVIQVRNPSQFPRPSQLSSLSMDFSFVFRMLTWAGAIRDREDGKDGAAEKVLAFRRRNLPVLDHIGYIGQEMVRLMNDFRVLKSETPRGQILKESSSQTTVYARLPRKKAAEGKSRREGQQRVSMTVEGTVMQSGEDTA